MSRPTYESLLNWILTGTNSDYNYIEFISLLERAEGEIDYGELLYYICAYALHPKLIEIMVEAEIAGRIEIDYNYQGNRGRSIQGMIVYSFPFAVDRLPDNIMERIFSTITKETIEGTRGFIMRNGDRWAYEKFGNLLYKYNFEMWEKTS